MGHNFIFHWWLFQGHHDKLIPIFRREAWSPGAWTAVPVWHQSVCVMEKPHRTENQRRIQECPTTMCQWPRLLLKPLTAISLPNKWLSQRHRRHISNNYSHPLFLFFTLTASLIGDGGPGRLSDLDPPQSSGSPMGLLWGHVTRGWSPSLKVTTPSQSIPIICLFRRWIACLSNSPLPPASWTPGCCVPTATPDSGCRMGGGTLSSSHQHVPRLCWCHCDYPRDAEGWEAHSAHVLHNTEEPTVAHRFNACCYCGGFFWPEKEEVKSSCTVAHESCAVSSWGLSSSQWASVRGVQFQLQALGYAVKPPTTPPVSNVDKSTWHNAWQRGIITRGTHFTFLHFKNLSFHWHYPKPS